ncbi:MAG: NBR1-Ig-like domain-containing protein, partial [Anaerolineales bacterium]|nr:NBR1-Ig-like domain-containing protein [Anaerolineales bacterium]
IPQGAVTLQAELNRALVELDNDGTLALLTDQYLGPHSGASPPPPPEATPAPGATPTPSAAACIDGMAYIEDLNYDDENMQNPPEFQKGESYNKGWRVRNVGTCAWTDQYQLRYVYGNEPESQMGGRPITIVGEVQTRQTVDMDVSLKAPTESGAYQGFWQMFNPAGRAFGETVWVGIIVPPEMPTPTVTSTPAPTVTPGPSVTSAPLPTWTPTPPPVVGPNWVLVLIADESGTPVDPVPGSVVTASFAADRTLSGSTSCNSYTGGYRAKESTIKITGVTATRLACPTDELNSQENKFLVLLEGVTRYAVAGNQLQLSRGDNVTLVFQGQ